MTWNWRRMLEAIEPHPKEHFKLKALALGLALMVWVQINGEDPVTYSIQSSPIDLANMPEGLAQAAPLEVQTLDVRVSARPRRGENLSPADFRPVIDLTNAQEGENQFFLSELVLRGMPSGLNIESISPSELSVVLDNEIDAFIPVTSVVEGEPAPGYEVTGRTVDPASVWITGAESRVRQISQIPTQPVSVRGLRSTFSQRVPLRVDDPLVDLGDDPAVNLTIEITEVPEERVFTEIGVEVINETYRVQVNPDTIGVVILGPPSLLDEVTADNLTAVIDVEGLEPRAEDYLLAPEIVFDPTELGETLEVRRFVPQQRLNVHVFDTRSQQ